MKTVQISKFKAECIGILKDVHKTEESITVTLRGKPIVTVHPARENNKKKRLGSLRGNMTVRCDLVSESSAKDWEMLKK